MVVTGEALIMEYLIFYLVLMRLIRLSMNLAYRNRFSLAWRYYLFGMELSAIGGILCQRAIID